MSVRKRSRTAAYILSLFVLAAAVWGPGVLMAQVIPGSPFGTGSGGATAPFADGTAIVKGGTDATKLLRFEVDGFTTGTTRVVTVPNSNGLVAYSDGSATWPFNQTFSGNMTISGKVLIGGGSTITVDAATTFAATTSYHILACTGAETINTITGGALGMYLVLLNNDTECTIADDDTPTAADAVNLTGVGTNDVGAVGKNLFLFHDGNAWQQLSESANN